MKNKLILFLIFILLLAVQVEGWCADRYYVSGGSGLYNNTNNWGTGSGSSSGASVPGASDNVIIDPNSPATLSLDVSPSIVDLTITGTSTVRKWIKSSVTGTARTITTSGTATLSYCDFQDITGGTTGGWGTGTSIGNCGGNSGISYTTPITLYWIGNGGKWSDPNQFSLSSGGLKAEVVPLCHDNVIFDPNSITSGSQTITCDMPRIGKDITFTGVTNTPALSFSQNSYVFGSLTFVPGMTLSGTSRFLYFENRSNCNFTSGGLTVPHALAFNNFGSALTFQDSYISNVDLYIMSGTININDKNLRTNSFLTSGSLTSVLNLGIGIFNVSGSGDYLWYNANPNLTIDPSTSIILFSSTSGTAKKFSGNSKIYNNLKFTGTSGAMVISGSNTFNTLESDTTAGANTISLTTATTQTLTKLFANTEPTKKLTLQSTTTTPAILTSSKDQFLRYTDLNYVTFQGSGNWYFDATTGTQANCTGLITTRNFSTFDTSRNTWNETNNTLGGNTTSKY